jgi:hypothetical protein
MLNHQVVLASRPEGWVTPANFRFQEGPIPAPGPEQVLIQNQWLSLDPYMRGRISEAKSYARSVNIGDVMVGSAVGEVIASNTPAFRIGDTVLAASGWQLFAAMDASAVTPIKTDRVSSSAYLGVLGMPGITAWTGLIDICQPREGETVVVDAASGAVGSVVGQLAKLQGCRVVGIAGGAEKCRYVTQALGFDVCVDHRAEDFADKLAAALPVGIDCLFENVGGAIFERLLTHMNVGSRIALCGMVSEFNREPHAYRTLRSILINRIRVQGFIVSDKLETWPGIRENLYNLVVEGKLKFRESVTEGLANAPQAFVGLLKGENFGKQLIKLR